MQFTIFAVLLLALISLAAGQFARRGGFPARGGFVRPAPVPFRGGFNGGFNGGRGRVPFRPVDVPLSGRPRSQWPRRF